MTATALHDAAEAMQHAIDAFVKECDNGGLAALTDEQFDETAREVEAMRRQLSAVDYPVVAEIERRNLPGVHLVRNAAGYLAAAWRISKSEAHARVKEAHACGERSNLLGERLPARRPALGEARRLGILGTGQSREIRAALDELPAHVPLAAIEEAERVLVQAAHVHGPENLRILGTDIRNYLDQDGPEPDPAEQARRAFLNLKAERDGMVRGSFRLTPEAGAHALAYFGQASRPRPEDATGRDERSPGQRHHDAFADLLALAFRAGEFAASVGVQHGVQVTMTTNQFESGTGILTSSMGQRLTVAAALRVADEACVGWIVHNSQGGILDYGRSRRGASPAQAAALYARDGGCAFPGCDHPAEWTERHHVHAWALGGPTSIDNLCLLCPYHHARLETQGWIIQMRSGVPWFIPPPLIDPTRTPIRNIRGLNTPAPAP